MMSGTMVFTEERDASQRDDSWYVILPPPVELGPCLTNTYLPKRSSQSSILSTASIRHREISPSPAFSDSVPSEGRVSASTLEPDEADVADEIKMSEGNRPQNGVNNDVNGNNGSQTPARNVSESVDSGLIDSSTVNSIVDNTGGTSREQCPEEEEPDSEDVHRLGSSEIDIAVPHSERDDGIDRGSDRKIMGGLQVGDRVSHQTAVQEAISEVSAECVSGNLSVSLSQHSMEATSSSELSQLNITAPPDSQPTEVRPETIISPLHSEAESVSGQSSQHDELSQMESLHKELFVDRTREKQIPSKIDSVEGHESPRPVDAGQMSQDLSEQTMEDTTQATLSEHHMEDTTQPTLSEHPVDDTTQGTIEISEYPIDTRPSLDRQTREEPVGQPRLVDSNENIIGTDSESYASSHSGDASTVVRSRHVVGGSTAQVSTTQSLSRPSSSASSVRSVWIARYADDSGQRSRDESMRKSESTKRKISDSTTASGVSDLTDNRRESGAGNMSEDSIGPRRSSDQSIKLRGSQVKLPLDLDTMALMSDVSLLIQTSELDGGRNGQGHRQHEMVRDSRNGSEQRSNNQSDLQEAEEQRSRGMPDRQGASYIQYPPSLQSRTPSETSRREVASRLSTLSHTLGSSRQDTHSLRSHEDDEHGLLRKVSPEGAEAADEDSRSQVSSQSGSIPLLPPSASNIPPMPPNSGTSQPGNARSYLNLDDLQTQDALADRVALLLGDAIVTTLSRDRPGVGDGGSSSEAGTPDSIETEKSERAPPSRDPMQDENGFPQRQPFNHEPPSSARSGTSIASYTDSLADRVAQILAESDAIKQIQAYQAAGGMSSPTPSDMSTSSSVRAIIDKVLQRTATGMGYISGDDASSQCSDIPPYPLGRNGLDSDNRQPMSPRHINLSKSMSVPLGSPYSPESARRTPSPTPYRDDYMQYSPRQGSHRGSAASYLTADTLDNQVQNLLAHTAYIDQPGMSPTYSPSRENPRLIHGRQSPIASPRLTTFDRIRQGEMPLRRHSATGIPRPTSYQPPTRVDPASYAHHPRAEAIGGGDQGFYLRMEPEGRSSLTIRPGQPGSQIPVAAASGRISPSSGYIYRRSADRRSTELTQPYEPHSPRGQYLDRPHSPRGQYIESPQSPRGQYMDTPHSPRGQISDRPHSPRGQYMDTPHSPRGLYTDSTESMDSLAHRVQAILAADQPGERANQMIQAGDFPLPEGTLQAAWQARIAGGSARASVHSSPYSSRHESPRQSHHGSPRAGSPRGFAPSIERSVSLDADVDVGMQEYGAFDRARNLLSNQMQRVTDMTFDHSVDVRDPHMNRLAGRSQSRRMTGQDQYVHSGIPIPRGFNQLPTSPRDSPLMSPRMHPQSGYSREAWGEDYQQGDDFQPTYYGSLPDNQSPGLPDDKDPRQFFPLKPHYSPAKGFRPVHQEYGSLPLSLAKSQMRYPQGVSDSNLPFGALPRSVSSPDIEVNQQRNRMYARQISDRIPRGESGERDGAEVKYKTWETDARAAQARMSPRIDRGASVAEAASRSPREYRRSMSYDSEQIRNQDNRASPRSFKPNVDQYTHGSHPSNKIVSPLGRDAYGASNIRPYRPPGSTEVQYTYPVTMDESSASNQTTVESSHPGSDDAQPPAFPPGTLGSRRDHSPLHSPHGQSRIPRYGRDSPQLDQTSDRNRGVPPEPDRSKPARSYIDYPSDLKSTDASAQDGLQKSPESQYRSRTDAGDRYQDKTSHFQTSPSEIVHVPAAPVATSPIRHGIYPAVDRPQSPRTRFSGIPVMRQDIGTTRAPEAEYARLPQSSDTGVVRELPPMHPSSRVSAGYRRASDSVLRAPHQHGGTSLRTGQQGSEIPLPPGNYSRKVLQDVIQNESDPRYAEIGQAWEEYERFRTATEGTRHSSLDSEKIRQVADLLDDPVKHTVTRWAKLDESDTQSESSYDSRTRRRKRWEKEQPFSPAQLNNSYDKDAKQQQSVDQSTTLETTLVPQSSTEDEFPRPLESVKHAKKSEDKEQHRKPDAKHHQRKDGDTEDHRQEAGAQCLRPPAEHVPDKDESTLDESSLTSVDTLLSDLSLESDQLYRLLGAQGVRKLSSKLVRLQNKIDRQKEHHRKREELAAKVEKKRGAPKMASTPAHSAPSVGDSTLQKVADTVKGAHGNGDVLCGHTLSPVAERTQETVELPSQITSESAVSEQEPPVIVKTREKPVVHRREYKLTERQLKKLERRRKHKHVNYRDDFHVSYGSETASDSLSEASVPCTCRPRRAKSLQDIAAKAKSKAAVTIEPKSHFIRKGTFRIKSSGKAQRLPSRIPVHSADDVQTRDVSTNYPSPAAQKLVEARKAPKATAFVITFPADKKKGKDEGRQAGEEDEGGNGKRQRRLQYRQRGNADGEGPKTGIPEPVAWFQPFSKKMPWQQDTPRKPLQSTQPPALQPPALKREGTKTVVKLSLQEAFLEKQAEFISRSRERQKKVVLAAEERQTQIQYDLERNKLFQDNRPPKGNTQAHPYSDQLHKPKKRNLSKKEIKEQTKKLYNQLPEVLQKTEDEKRVQTYQSNRMKAQIYRKKLSDRAKGKAWNET